MTKYYSGDQIEKNEIVGENAARKEERRGANRLFVEKPEEVRPLGIPKRVWEDNIKMYV